MSWSARVLAADMGPDHEGAREFVARCDAGHFFQYPGWAEVAGIPGDLARLVIAENRGEIGLVASLTFARVGGMGPWVAHVERGPVAACPEALAAALPVLLQEARRRKVASLRVSPYVAADDVAVAEVLRGAGFKPARTSFDYHRTLEADLQQDKETLLRSYRKGHRKDVQKALLAGVEVTVGGEAEAEVFDRFYRDMVSRKGAPARPQGFFQRLARFCGAAPERRFFLMSRLGDRYLAGLFVMCHGRRAIGAFGASPQLESNLPRTHVLHYEAMLRGKARGCQVYDMGGYSMGTGLVGQRSARQYNNIFKKGFARREVDLLPVHEFIFRPLHHAAVETGRKLLGGA